MCEYYLYASFLQHCCVVASHLQASRAAEKEKVGDRVPFKVRGQDALATTVEPVSDREGE
jgi:hypothetical protein